ncbi:MAG: hypothetical protein RIS41_128 [Actinomycetota bacterium]|jgi:hypothetical protein
MSRVRHAVLFRWKPGVTPEHVAAAEQALRELPSKVPSIRSYLFGRNLGINPGTYDYAVIAEFDDREGYLEYRDHPDHQAFIAAYTADYVAERAAIQMEV